MRKALETGPHTQGAGGTIGLLLYACREIVAADTDPRNSASLGFLRSVGFEVTWRQERTSQVGPYQVPRALTGAEAGEWVDSVFLALQREVWIEGEREKKSKWEEVERREIGSRTSV